MVWWVLALLSGTGLALRNVLFKVSNNEMDAAFSAMILSVSMAVVAIGYFLFQKFSESAPLVVNFSTKGIVFAIMAGTSLAAANIFLAFAYKTGGMASVTGIIQNGFAISLTVLLGILFLGEDIKLLQIMGAMVAAAGIFMIIKG